MLRRHFFKFLPVLPMLALSASRGRSDTKHLEMFSGVIQCTKCLYQQSWEGEGEVGNYRIFIEEWHDEDCPLNSRNGTKVYKEDLSCYAATSSA